MGRVNFHVGSAKQQISRNQIAAVIHPEKRSVTSQRWNTKPWLTSLWTARLQLIFLTKELAGFLR